ncbi:hypothetical protein [Cellulomonas soli]
MLRSIGRLAAAAVAIGIGAAFLTATLLAGKVMTRAGYDAVTATYAKADLVAMGDFTPADLETARRQPGVAAADALQVSGLELTSPLRTVWQPMLATATDPRLSSLEIVEGAAPAAPGQIALDPDALERLAVGVGDEVTVSWVEWGTTTPNPSSAPRRRRSSVRSPTRPVRGRSTAVPGWPSTPTCATGSTAGRTARPRACSSRRTTSRRHASS